jgi:hypothetical protein
VQLTALPDTLNADGVSVSVVQLVLRNQNGRPVSGRAVLFEHDGDGLLAPSAASTFVGPIQTGIVMATDNDGVAYVVYVAGTAHADGDGVGQALRDRRRQPVLPVGRDLAAVIP